MKSFTASDLDGRLWSAVIISATVIGFTVRLAGLAMSPLTFDETSTGTFAKLPLTEIPLALRSRDIHPPLDYLIRHSLAWAGNDLLLRIPSALTGAASLLLVVWWMRQRGWFGAFVIVFMALSSMAVRYSVEARMYGLLILAGILVAVAADRYLRIERFDARVGAVLITGLLLGLFAHESGLLLAFGSLALPGVRRGGAAWRWRTAVLAATAVWGVAWGSAFMAQATNNSPTWVPYTSVDTVAWSLNGLMRNLDTDASYVFVTLLIAGWICLGWIDRQLSRAVVCICLIPFAAVAGVGLDRRVLIPRTLAFGMWAAPVGLAALLEALRRWRTHAGLVAVPMVLVVAMSLPLNMTYQESSIPSRKHLETITGPGDGVVISPGWLSPWAEWPLDAPHDSVPPPGLEGVRDNGSFLFVRRGAPFNGRVWVLSADPYPVALPGLHPCPVTRDDSHDADFSVRCFEQDRQA